MLFEEMLRDEHAQGKAEGKAEDILDLLAELGEVPAELRSQIMEETNLEELKRLLKEAAGAESVEQFMEAASNA